MKATMISIACALALAGCNGSAGDGEPTPSPTPMLIVMRGVTTSLPDAVHQIAFRAHPPRAQVLAVALIPPLGNADTSRTRGIAFEYSAGGMKWLLSEWPSQGFNLMFGSQSASAPLCSPVPFSRTGFAWTTRDKLAMTLQPDGSASIAQTRDQARLVMTRLACR